MDSPRGKTTRFSPTLSRNVAIYFRKIVFRYVIVSELWLNHGKTARFVANASTIRARHKGQPFKQVNILFVLQKRPVQAWQLGLAIAAQVLGRQILGQKKL